MSKHVQRKTDWTPEDRARHQAIREQFKHKPTLKELRESGEVGESMPLGLYLELQQALHQLKVEREKAGLSLTDIAERTGMDKAVISRLETGKQGNPTIATLVRYAKAIGKELVLGFRDVIPTKS